MVRRLSILLAILAVLAACGAPASPAGQAPTPAPAAVGPTVGPITVTDLKGELRLDAPATRVVACSDESVDLVLALGVQPVGICSARAEGAVGEAFQPGAYFFPAEQLGAPTFVGSSLEPSVERIVALKPDLVILNSDSDTAYEQLAQAVPTFYVDMESPGYWTETLGELGRALGREAAAQEFLASYAQTVERVREQVAPLVAEHPRALVAYSFSPDPQMMLFKPGTWLSKGLEQIGFTVPVPAGVTFADADWAIVSSEYLNEVEADLIVVLRPTGPDGALPTYPIDTLLSQLESSGTRVVYQPLDPTRSSSAPLTDRFVIEQYGELLPAEAATR